MFNNDKIFERTCSQHLSPSASIVPASDDDDDDDEVDVDIGAVGSVAVAIVFLSLLLIFIIIPSRMANFDAYTLNWSKCKRTQIVDGSPI